jgi:choline dehydrogenase
LTLFGRSVKLSSVAHDVLIVGGGTAGCVLARRLSDQRDVNVLVIEAGGEEDHPGIADPTAYYGLWETDVVWRYFSEPQIAMAGRRQYSPRGRVLGGSSSINGMVWFRGAGADYDAWALQGNDGWDWATVEPVFAEVERILRPAWLPDPNPLSQVFLDACAEVGHQTDVDFDSGELVGAGWNRSTVLDGQRHSAYSAFLAPVRRRPNLTVITHARATRLLTSSTRVVLGVEYVDEQGHMQRAYASETVVCAGSFDSPKLLLLSGIGPPRELEALGIRPLVELPVGRGLMDHVLLGVVYRASQELPRANAHLTEATLFAKSGSHAPASDVQISFNKEPHFADGYVVDGPAFTIIPGITRPDSRGWVRLRSSNPADAPLIDPRHLTEEADIRTMLRGIELAREIGESDCMAQWQTGEIVPGPQAQSDTSLRAFIANVASTWYHSVGTCRMGPERDPDAVVDSDLRVYGVKGLRVVDASIMPTIVSANTNGAVTMIAWKAGDAILRGR